MQKPASERGAMMALQRRIIVVAGLLGAAPAKAAQAGYEAGALGAAAPWIGGFILLGLVALSVFLRFPNRKKTAADRPAKGASVKVDPALEQDFRNMFPFADRDHLLSETMKERKCGRHEAMMYIVEKWRRENRSWRV